MISNPGDSDVALTPSDDPCCIKEEGKEDLFVPIKTQSGYLEVITGNIFLAKQIIPTEGASRAVIIYETMSPTSYSQPLWVGWVQPKMLTFTPWMGKQKLRIPIECKLSGYKYLQPGLPSANVVSIGELLYRLLSGCSNVYFQGAMVMEREGVTADQTRAWLRKKVYTSMFSADQSRYDVLKKICIFFGWTCRSYGMDIYLMSNRNVDAVNTAVNYIPWTELKATAYSSFPALWAEVSLLYTQLCSASNKVIFTEGCRKATATCSLETFDQSTDIDFVQIGVSIDNGTINPVHTHNENEWSSAGHEYKREDEYYGTFAAVTVGDFTVQGYNVAPQLDKNGSTDVNEWTAGLAVLYTCDYTTDTYWVPSTDPSSDGYWRTDVQIADRYYGNLSFKSVNPVSYETAGVITLKLSLNDTYMQHASLFVRIGDNWYNPGSGSWQQTKPSKCITVQKNEDNRYEYSIPVANAMAGTLELLFVADPSYEEYAYTRYCLESVSVEYKSNQSETYDSEISEVVVSAVNNAKFSEEVDYTSSICIKGTLIANSKNFLMDPDGNASAGLYDTPYSDAKLFSPLQRLCDETVTERKTTGEYYEVSVRWRGGIQYDITPNTMVMIAPLAVWAYCVGWELNLRDDVIKLKLLKRVYSEGQQ